MGFMLPSNEDCYEDQSFGRIKHVMKSAVAKTTSSEVVFNFFNSIITGASHDLIQKQHINQQTQKKS